MKDLLLFCLTTAASALPDARGDRVHRRDVPLPYPQHQQASLARRSTGRANGRDQTSPARSLVRRGVGELKAGQIGGAYPHMQDNVIGSDYFNWLPHNLDAEAKAPITQAKSALERLEKQRDRSWYDAGMSHWSKEQAHRDGLRYDDLTEQQHDIAQMAAARALQAHKGPIPHVTGFHADPSLHGHKHFRDLPDDLHPVARLLVAGGASRMRAKQWERVDGEYSMEQSERIGGGYRGNIAASKREQEQIAKVTAHNALALHHYLNGKELSSMTPQEVAKLATHSDKKAKALPSIKSRPQSPLVEEPESESESEHERKRGPEHDPAFKAKNAPLALPAPGGWRSAEEEGPSQKEEEGRSKKTPMRKWFKSFRPTNKE